MKTKRKVLSILVTLSMLMALLVPMAAPAGASSAYSALGTIPVVDDDGVYSLANVKALFSAGEIEAGQTLHLYLPNDFQFLRSAAQDNLMTNADWAAGTFDNYVDIPTKVGNADNGIQPGDVTITMADENEIAIAIDNVTYTGNDAMFILHMGQIYVDSGFDGEIELTAEAPGGGLPSGTVTVGTVGSGDVTISVTDSETDNDEFDVTLRIKESRASALEDDTDETIKFVLPSGFVWEKIDLDYVDPGKNIKTIWGDENMVKALVADYDDEELSLKLAKDKDSTSATYFEVSLAFKVDDETKAKYGDVQVKIKGDSTIAPTEAVVGTYGDYNGAISSDDPETQVFAGLADQEISDITLKENIKATFVEGRTITLQLPSNARWVKVDGDDVSTIGIGTALDDDNSLRVVFKGFIGDDNRTLKLGFEGESDDAAELVLEDLSVALEAGKTGDLVVKASGSAGLSGEVTVAKVVGNVTAASDTKPNAIIGLTNQKAGDLIITEGFEGAISDDYKCLVLSNDLLKVSEPDKTTSILLDLPEGIMWAAVPTVEVIEGDLDVDESGVYRQDSGQTNNNQLVIPIEGDSNTISKIKVSNITYTLDRTVPEGDVKVSVMGPAVVQTAPAATATDVSPWPNSKSAASAFNATCVTPAPDQQKATAVFKIGDTKYTVNGIEQTMDVAPYIKGDRTYMPLRYVALAAGVVDSNIMWNAADQSIVLIKGDRVVKLAIGSNTLLINGISFTMDVAPEIVDPGRTMLPLRAVAQALGGNVNWDAATQTVTIN